MWLQDAEGDLVDLSSGYTFTWKIGLRGQAAMFTKTSGISGAAGAGVEPTGTPNVTLDFNAGDLDAVTPGPYVWQLVARTSGLDRVWEGEIRVMDVIT
jgi:hypothetical protein